MKTLNLYVAKNFAIVLFASVGVLTFAMIGGNLVKVFEAMSQGIPPKAALLFMIYIIPLALSFTVPWAILVSVLILFGRMSADNEITAMRACGISIFQIISPVVVITFLLTCVTLWLQTDIAPKYNGKARELIETVGIAHPEALIEPGGVINFDNTDIIVKDRNAQNELVGLQIYCFDKRRTTLLQDITADKGMISPNSSAGALTIVLKDFTIIDYKDKSLGNRVIGDQMDFTFDIGEQLKDRPVGRQLGVMTLRELLGCAVLYRRQGLDTTQLEVILNQQLALGLSPIAFLLLGLPLAIRTSRRETFVGFFLSVILAGAYFFFIIGIGNLYDRPKVHPQLLLWIPTVIYQLGGLFFLKRITSR